MFEAEVEWSCPENFPNLSGYKYVAIDLETRDPNLKNQVQVRFTMMERLLVLRLQLKVGPHTIQSDTVKGI